MCGRCACTRDKESIQTACAFRRKNGSSSSVAKPVWISANSQTYCPSYNTAPQSNTPVIISGGHDHVEKYFKTNDNIESSRLESNERVIQVMKWGLIPSWHKGTDSRSFPTLLNNCRYDGMFDKPSFRNAITRKQRCVVLADGFYEWQREKVKDKKAFYIYPSESSCTEETKELLLEHEFVDTDTSVHISFNRMLTMAGYFDIWRSDSQEDSVLYTYTIITVDANDSFGSIHHRMPAILEGQEAISMWLDPKIPPSQAARLIDPRGKNGSLAWHPVSSFVNNVRNKSAECIVKVDHSIIASRGNQSLLKWFKKSPKESIAGKDEEVKGPIPKKIKTE